MYALRFKSRINLLKVSLVVVAATLLVLVASGAASASHSDGQSPKIDFVSGTGREIVPEFSSFELHVNAESGPSGEDPRGRSSGSVEFFERGTTEFSGRVTCLNVVGNAIVEDLAPTTSSSGVFANPVPYRPNLATVGGELERVEGMADPQIVEGEGIIFLVEDNPGGEDRFQIYGSTETPPTECPPPFPSFNLVEQGNFVVHDAAP
jgi:hypothetical protein